MKEKENVMEEKLTGKEDLTEDKENKTAEAATTEQNAASE